MFVPEYYDRPLERADTPVQEVIPLQPRNGDRDRRSPSDTDSKESLLKERLAVKFAAMSEKAFHRRILLRWFYVANEPCPGIGLGHIDPVRRRKSVNAYLKRQSFARDEALARFVLSKWRMHAKSQSVTINHQTQVAVSMIEHRELVHVSSAFHSWLRLADDIKMGQAAVRIKRDTEKLFRTQHKLDGEITRSDRILELLNGTLNFSENKNAMHKSFYAWLVRTYKRRPMSVSSLPSATATTTTTTSKAEEGMKLTEEKLHIFGAPAWPGPNDILSGAIAEYEGNQLPPMTPLYLLPDVLARRPVAGAESQSQSVNRRTAKSAVISRVESSPADQPKLDVQIDQKGEATAAQTVEAKTQQKSEEIKVSWSDQPGRAVGPKQGRRKSPSPVTSESVSESSKAASRSASVEDAVMVEAPIDAQVSESSSETSSDSEPVAVPTTLVQPEVTKGVLARALTFQSASGTESSESESSSGSSASASSSSSGSSSSDSSSASSDTREPLFKLSLSFFTRMRRVVRQWTQRARDIVAKQRLDASISEAVEKAMQAWRPAGVPTELQMPISEAIREFADGAFALKRKGAVTEIDVKDRWFGGMKDQKRFFVGQIDNVERFILYYATREAWERKQEPRGWFSLEELKMAKYSYRLKEMGVYTDQKSSVPIMKKVSKLPEKFFVAIIVCVRHAIGGQVRKNSGFTSTLATRA